MYDDQFATDT